MSSSDKNGLFRQKNNSFMGKFWCILTAGANYLLMQRQCAGKPINVRQFQCKETVSDTVCEISENFCLQDKYSRIYNISDLYQKKS